MSYKFSFADNAIYSATDVNGIVQRFVTSGVEDTFADGVAYNVSKFNDIGKLLYTSGAVPEDYNSLKVTKVSDTEILINPGLAFFDDGATIEIEAGGETLTFVSGSKNYVYLKNDLVEKNICYPFCSADEPTGDFVLLAEIDENGEITDKRTYAKGKLGGYQSIAGNAMFFKETMTATVESESYGSGDAEFDIGNNTFKYIIFTNALTDNVSYPNLSIYRISDGATVSFYTFGNYENNYLDTSGAICVYAGVNSTKYMVNVSLENGILKVHADLYCLQNALGQAGDKKTVNLNLIFI